MRRIIIWVDISHVRNKIIIILSMYKTFSVFFENVVLQKPCTGSFRSAHAKHVEMFTLFAHNIKCTCEKR